MLPGLLGTFIDLKFLNCQVPLLKSRPTEDRQEVRVMLAEWQEVAWRGRKGIEKGVFGTLGLG